MIRPNTQITFGFNTQLAPGDSTGIRNIELNNVPLATDSGTGNGGTLPATGTVSSAVRAEWVDGATIDMTVRNTGTTPINGWTVSFDADFEITEVWNAQLVGRVGNRYTIRNIPGHWAAVIRPGTQIEFGFNARLGAGDGTEIRNVTLNANNP
jgi:Cellulose binding domain